MTKKINVDDQYVNEVISITFIHKIFLNKKLFLQTQN